MSAKVISLFERRVEAAKHAEVQATREVRRELGRFKLRIETKPRNRYDAAFKGVMTRRSWELISALRNVEYDFYDAERRKRFLKAVIREIEMIRDEVLRTTPEHHRPISP